jgi:signal transduction histidine kinase
MTQIGEFLIQNEHEIPFARQLTQRLCLLAKLSIGNQARLTTAVSQVTQSLFHYASCVRISFTVVSENGQNWLQVVVEERKPSVPFASVKPGSKLSRDDLLNWLEGIGSIITVYSTELSPGKPVRVTMAKPFPPWQKSISEETIQEWSQLLKNEPPKEPIEVILQQNRELVGVLDTLREKDASLEKKIKEIEALEKMRDDLVHALVHDLRNPLSSIRSSLSGLLHNNVTNLSRYQQTMIEISYLGSMKMTQLVDNILEVYKLERETLTIEPVLISLSDLVERQIRLQEPLLGEKHISGSSCRCADRRGSLATP